jgi:hypothetical protein
MGASDHVSSHTPGQAIVSFSPIHGNGNRTRQSRKSTLTFRAKATLKAHGVVSIAEKHHDRTDRTKIAEGA